MTTTLRRGGSAAMTAVAALTLATTSSARAGIAFDWIAPSGFWSDAANWDRGVFPDNAVHEVFIGRSVADPTVWLDAARLVERLELENGAVLDTDGHKLTVELDLQAQQNAGLMVEVLVRPRSDDPAKTSIDAGQIRLVDGALLSMQGGVVELDDLLSVDAPSRVSGHGSIDLGDAAAVIALEGTLRSEGGDLRLLTPATGSLDVGSSAFIDVTSGSSLVIDAPMTLPPGATTTVDGRLGIERSLDAHDATIAGSGLIEINGTLAARTGLVHVDLAGGLFDWDGAGSSSTMIDPGVTLRIDAGEVEADGASIVDHGHLIVDVTAAPFWRLGGSLTLDATPPGAPAEVTVDGSPIELSTGGQIEVHGAGRLLAPLDLEPGSTLLVPGPGDTLTLGQGGELGGASIIGDGTLVLDGFYQVSGDASIDTTSLIWDGALQSNATVIPAGSSLSINSSTIAADPVNDGYDGTAQVHGDLAVNTDDAWRLDGQLQLFPGGGVSGQPIVISAGGRVRAMQSGGVREMHAAVRVEPNGLIETAASATIHLRDTLTLDGQSLSTPIIGGAGTVRPHEPIIVETDSFVEIDEFDIDGNDDGLALTTIQAGATLELHVSSFEPTSNQVDATIVLDGQSALDVRTDAGSWQLAGTLLASSEGTLDGDHLLLTGDIIGGLSSNAWSIQNSGVIEATSDGGGFQLAGGYVQGADGELEVELGGTPLDPQIGFVQLSAEPAQLGGHLEVRLVDGLVPQPGDLFPVLVAPEINGAFDTIDAPGFVIHYVPQQMIIPPSVIAEFVALPCLADTDGSGSVDSTDLLQLLAEWGPCSSCAGDLDRNDVVDVSDLLQLLASWGQCP